VTDDEKKARAILDGLTLESTHGLSLAALAQLVADEFATLEKARDDLAEKLDDIADAALDAESGYHAFATALAWRYPDGESMPSWNGLDEDTQRAFRAFAQGAIR
jgi:hypothetical protein